MRHIITSQAGAFRLALSEAGNPFVLRLIEPGVALCENARVSPEPIFLRHICPAQTEVSLAGTDEDLRMLQKAFHPLLNHLQSQDRFSVQTRIAHGFAPSYKPFDVNTTLCKLCEQTGAILDVKKPERIVSVVLAREAGWIGVSSADENLHDWAGGTRRFKWEEDQISRAEFKLLEAVEQFGIKLEPGMRALDLGAAPGGWSRVLRNKGLSVTAVDPADLDGRLADDRLIRHVKSTAQAYFAMPEPCDVLVNDMKMDSEQSASITMEGASCLREGGEALLTLKLPDRTTEWLPRIHQAKRILSDRFTVVRIRQLFHNRSEVMIHLKKGLSR